MNERPKWYKEPEPALNINDISEAAAGMTGTEGPSNRPDGPVAPDSIPVDVTMRKLSELSHERQQRLRRLLLGHLVLKRYNLLSLSADEIETIIGRLPE